VEEFIDMGEIFTKIYKKTEVQNLVKKEVNNCTPKIIVELMNENVPDDIVKLTEEMILTHGEGYLIKEWRKSKNLGWDISA
jgi:hypothetical protein